LLNETLFFDLDDARAKIANLGRRLQYPATSLYSSAEHRLA
jgi:hypothetical protein